MAEWPLVALQDLVVDGAISYGIVQPGADQVEGIPIIRVKDLDGGLIDRSSPLRVAPEISARYARTVLSGGEVLVSIVGTVGEAAVVPADLAGWNVARAIAVLRPTGVSAEWLSLALRTDQARTIIGGFLNTTVQATLNLADLKRLPIPMPPEPERRAITEVIGALDDKIAANHRTVRLADELAVVVIRRAFSGETVAMVDVATVTMGSSPPGSSYNEGAQGLPFYQGVRDFGVRFPSRRVWTDKPVRLAAARDTLLSVRAPVGRTNLAEEDICIGRGLAALRAKDGCAMTLFHQVRAAHAAWAPYEAEGTVFGAINRAQLEAIELPALAPGSAVQVETRLAAVEALIASSLHETSALARTRDELLPLLMSGRVRVKDAEKSMEGVL